MLLFKMEFAIVRKYMNSLHCAARRLEWISVVVENAMNLNVLVQEGISMCQKVLDFVAFSNTQARIDSCRSQKCNEFKRFLVGAADGCAETAW